MYAKSLGSGPAGHLYAFLVLIFFSLSQSVVAAANEPEIGIINHSSNSLSSTPFTFAQVVKRGHFSGTSQFALQNLDTNERLALQADVKALHDDGSVRHVILSGLTEPLSAHEQKHYALIRVASGADQSPPDLTALLQSGWDADVNLSLGDTAYTASAASLLQNTTPSLWLDGTVVKEWQVSGDLEDQHGNAHPHLSVRFHVRAYTGLNKVRTTFVIENNWAYEPDPQNFVYDATISVTGSSGYQVDDLKHLRNSRWRKVFWSGGESPLQLTQDAEYIMATGATPNYDPALISNISQTLLNQYQSRWVDEIIVRELGDNGYDVPVGSGGIPYSYNKIGPMGIGFADFGMPNTGARPDIGPLTQWAAVHLLAQQQITETVMLGMGDSSASWSIHFRDRDTGLPLSIDEYPYASSHPDRNLSRNPDTGKYEQIAKCTGSNTDCFVPYRQDTAHQPSFAYLPYLLTGDFYYLEELQFWVTYNFLSMNPTYRQTSKGLFERVMQDRGQAWSMRKLGQTAFITPDSHPLKAYFEDKLQQNLTRYHQKYVLDNPNDFGSMIPNYSYPTHSPWMDDFFTWSIGFLVGLGYQEAEPLLRWKAKFPVQRMGFGAPQATNYCWIFAATYHLLVAPDKDSPMFRTIDQAYDGTNGQSIPFGGGFNDGGTACGSQEQADYLGLQLGEMPGYSASPAGFPSNLQIGLAAATESGIAGADQAWERFSHRANQPDYRNNPVFAIVPRRIVLTRSSSELCVPLPVKNRQSWSLVCL